MAHRVRVLHNPDQKTIRMHYANCNTFNADFDGDEMNCHFPQNDLARAEAQYIVQTDLQYIVPTDGSPLRGLIQDHVVGGVKMTKRDTFFKRWEFQQLLFAAMTSLSGLEVIRHDSVIEMVPPAIVKPCELWTGKQIRLFYCTCERVAIETARHCQISKDFPWNGRRKHPTRRSVRHKKNT
jgi:DNA-directed RNA polymerase I subunit RPA1